MSGAHARQQTLRQRLEREGPLSLSAALDILQSLLDQVDALHAAGHIHRGISVDSVTFDEQGRPRLGRAEPRVPIGGSPADPTTNPPELKLPRRIFLPEDLERARQLLQQAGASLDPRRIDVYHLGAVLVHLLTGSPLGHYLRSPQVAGSLAPAVRPVIERALGYAAGSPAGSCQELRQSLQQIRAAAPQDGRGQRIPRPQPARASVPPAGPSAPPGPLPVEPDLPFERLAHFRILGRIGAGGMGDVYKGYDETLHRQVAIKVLPAEFARHAEFVRRFKAEATAAAALAHPNVVPIYFIGQDGPHHFFAMQFVEGESLADRLRREPRLPADAAVAILQDCLHGLSAAHRRGMIHRDIKPGNILLEARTQRALLADFGLVHRRDESTRLTATGTVLGTVDYIAPEQARGQAVDGRADLYALGILLYQMLSGRLPFEADTPTAMLFQHAYEPPLPLEQAAPGVDPRLAAIAARLMAKQPDDRYQDCQQALAALESLAVGKRRPAPSSGALSAVIPAPDFGAAPPLPAAAGELARPRWWQAARDRVASVLRARVPALVQELQNTEQRVDGALAEYERRRRALAALIEQAQSVAQELADHGRAFREAEAAAAARFQAAVSESERAEALEDRLRSVGAANDVLGRFIEQKEQLDGMRVQLAQVDARLAELRSQRDLLLARLKVARARLQMAEGRPRAPGLRWTAVLAAAAVVLVVLGIVYWRKPEPGVPIGSVVPEPKRTVPLPAASGDGRVPVASDVPQPSAAPRPVPAVDSGKPTIRKERKPIAKAQSAKSPVAQAKRTGDMPPPAIAPFDAATARKHQEAWAKYLNSPVELEGPGGMVFVLIPPGEFDMGPTDEEIARLAKDARVLEVVQRRVQILQPFYLGQCEVTQGQFERIIRKEHRGPIPESQARPSLFRSADDNAPVAGLTAAGGQRRGDFLHALSRWSAGESRKQVFRLPSEAEWEYACRAGSTTMYNFGDDESALDARAWWAGNSGDTVHPVAQTKPNAFGLFDMHGNLAEECVGWWDAEKDTASAWIDVSQGTARVWRGGGYSSYPATCRSAARWLRHPRRQEGLRLVLASPMDNAGPAKAVSVPSLAKLTATGPSLPLAAPASGDLSPVFPLPRSLAAVDEWHPIGISVGLHLGSTTKARVRVRSAWFSLGSEDMINVAIEITNAQATEPLEYMGWLDPTTATDEARALMVDDSARVLRPLTKEAKGAIAPGKTAIVHLSFYLRSKDSLYHRLVLPWAAFGEAEYVGYSLPTRAIKDQPPPTIAPTPFTKSEP